MVQSAGVSLVEQRVCACMRVGVRVRDLQQRPGECRDPRPRLHTRPTHSLRAAMAQPALASQSRSQGLAATFQGMGRCSDWCRHRGARAVIANGCRTLTLWLLVRVSWEEPQVSGLQSLSAAATLPLPARAGVHHRAAGTLTNYIRSVVLSACHMCIVILVLILFDTSLQNWA